MPIFMRHGLFELIESAKRNGVYYRTILEDPYYSELRHIRLRDIALPIAVRAFKLFRLKTVGEWNDLCCKVGARLSSHHHYTCGKFGYIHARKDHWPVIYDERYKRFKLKRKCWEEGASVERKEKRFEGDHRKWIKDEDYRESIKSEYLRVLRYESKQLKRDTQRLRKELKNVS